MAPFGYSANADYVKLCCRAELPSSPRLTAPDERHFDTRCPSKHALAGSHTLMDHAQTHATVAQICMCVAHIAHPAHTGAYGTHTATRPHTDSKTRTRHQGKPPTVRTLSPHPSARSHP